MSKQQNYICDWCSTILLGMDRAAFISKSYKHIKGGSMTAQLVDPETGRRYFVYLTSRPDDELSFCWGTDCEQSWTEDAVERYHNRRKRDLMDEVGQVGGSKYVQRPENSDMRELKRNNFQAPAPAPYPPNK